MIFLPLCGWLTLMAGLESQQKPATSECLPKAQSQAEMEQCSSADMNAAEKEMNLTYRAILKRYADRPVFIQRLREAQRAWLRLRDAQMAMRFPIAAQENPRHEWGSAYPMCYAMYKAELTRRRTKELKEWQDGVPEGDVCSGSVRHSDDAK
jgi:uncharacterized protein YecT (DUF1311 family)